MKATNKQVYRWYRTLFDKVTAGYGYQCFGFDETTMQINHPGFFTARKRLQELLK